MIVLSLERTDHSFFIIYLYIFILFIYCRSFSEEMASDAAGSEKPTLSEDAMTTATTPTVMTAPTTEVDTNHPEVQQMVAAAVAVAQQQVVTLPPDVYLEVIQVAIKDTEKEMRLRNPNGPM